MEGARRVAPARRERDRKRAPVARDGGPGDQAAAFGPVGQPGERRLLDAEQAGQFDMPRDPPASTQQPGLRGRRPWRSATRAKADCASTDSRISPSATGWSLPAVNGSPARSGLKMFVMFTVIDTN